MAEYLGNEPATSAAFTDDGYLRTGDLATLTNDEGFIHVGRMGDAMRLSGFLVDPLEIEQVLLEDSSLRAAQAVDVVTPAGRRPVAFVIPVDGTSPDETALIAHCRAVLAPFKTPIRIFGVDAFPTIDGPNGIKVQRHQLRARAQEMLEGDV
jgi:fatty-acyl-CoA synthase